MNEELQARFGELMKHGGALVAGLPRDEYGPENWIRGDQIPQYQRWLTSVVNLLSIVTVSDSFYVREASRLMGHAEQGQGIMSATVQKMAGLLESAYEEWQRGLLRKIEFIVAASTFDDFLDHAAMYHKGNKKVEAAVLASAVLEDTAKKIAVKNAIATAGRSLEELIDDLVKADVLTLVKGKRVKGHAAVRNRALHAEWDEFDIKDVGELIGGTRFVAEHGLGLLRLPGAPHASARPAPARTADGDRY
jgi:hypothetical protein